MLVRISRNTLLLAGSILLVVMIACGSSTSSSDEPEATATLVPTSTPESPGSGPTPVPATSTPASPGSGPITIDPSEDPDGFIAALPADEVMCASDGVGGADIFRELVAADDAIGAEATDALAEVLASCISAETVQNVMIGQLISNHGGLSDETISCIGNSITGVDFSNVLGGLDFTGDDLIQAVEALFCLSPEERLAFEESNPSDDGDEESAPDLAVLGTVLATFETCGINLADFADSDTGWSRVA